MINVRSHPAFFYPHSNYHINTDSCRVRIYLHILIQAMFDKIKKILYSWIKKLESTFIRYEQQFASISIWKSLKLLPAFPIYQTLDFDAQIATQINWSFKTICCDQFKFVVEFYFYLFLSVLSLFLRSSNLVVNSRKLICWDELVLLRSAMAELEILFEDKST